MDISSFFIAFSIGVLGGAHCIGMCGGIMGALTMAIDDAQYQRRFLMVVSYNLGRITSYLLIAGVFYALVSRIEDYFALSIMRTLSGFLLIAMGLYLANWWRGLVYIEKAGSYLWRYIQPLSRSLLPVTSFYQAFLLGILWGWLPCGLIYSALVYSSAAQSTAEAVMIMLAFALGTLPAVMASGLLAERLAALIKYAALRKTFAVCIIVFGIWTQGNWYRCSLLVSVFPHQHEAIHVL